MYILKSSVSKIPTENELKKYPIPKKYLSYLHVFSNRYRPYGFYR